MPERDTLLRLEAPGGIEAHLMRDLLGAVDAAHSGYIAFERLISEPRWYGDYQFSLLTRPPWSSNFGAEAVDVLVSPRERLIVMRVELASPGFWEFLGALNPLEVTRKYLDDRHRRRQDREYREAAEKRRLGLENDLLEIEVVRQALELAQRNGLSTDDLQPVLRRLVGEPLERLAALQDRGVIEGGSAEIHEIGPGEDDRPG